MKTILLILLASGCLCFPLLPARASEPDIPNILWITAEDMSPQLGCYGDAYADTPQIDCLATRSIRYTNFFAESPMCAPSRSTIISGMHNGPLGTTHQRAAHRVPAFVRPFSAYLREAGFYCVNNAKTDYNLSRTAPGDSTSFFADDASFLAEGWDECSRKAHWRNRPAGKPFFCIFNYLETHQSRTSRDSYDNFVERVQSRLDPSRVHDPAKAPLPPQYPGSDIARRTVARCYDCITSLDDFVAKTLADLKADGLADDTIVFLYSDHGAGMPTGKGCATNYGLRCPLVVFIPDKFRRLAPGAPGSVSDRLVCFADLGPTVLNLAGMQVPEHMHGRPFLGENLPAPPRFVLGTRDRLDEAIETTRWITDGRYLLVRSYRRNLPFDQQSLISYYNSNGELCQEIRALKAARKLTETQFLYWGDKRPARLLFDCKADPWNVDDIAGDPAHCERVEAMEQALESFLLAERDLGFLPEAELGDPARKTSAYEWARTPGNYPVERILETAKLEEPAELRKRLAEDHVAVRYWAVVGLSALGAAAKPALGDLTPLLNDKHAAVRIEAAALVASLSDSPAAIARLAAELESPNQWAACHAARALELLGEKARPATGAMRAALENRSAGYGGKPKGTNPINYALQFAVETALNKLEPNP